MTRPPPDRATTQIDTPIPNVKVTVEELISLVARYRAASQEVMREFHPINAVQRGVLQKLFRLNQTLTQEIPVVMP